MSGYPSDPEYGALVKRLHLDTEITLEQAEAVLPDVFAAQDMGNFVLTNASIIEEKYGIGLKGDVQLKAYFGFIAFEFTNKTLGAIFARGGGLFTTRTVRCHSVASCHHPTSIALCRSLTFP